MKHLKLLTLILLMGLLSQAVVAQDASTQGTEFWLSFMSNGHKYHPDAPNNGNWVLIQVLISGKRDCNGTISNPDSGWSIPFEVQANHITTIEIPEGEAYIDATSEQVQNKGIQIISNDTISVFCTNIAHLSFDASYVLPIQSLSDEYIIQTYDQSYLTTAYSYQTTNQTSAFLIVATQNNTVVEITPSVGTLGGHAAGQTFSISLNKGQAYQVRSNNNSTHRDLSGSRVVTTNNKPIAVFNGNNLTAIPENGSSFDHIFEQAMPLQSWGRKFVVTSSLEREKDYVKITSADDNNQVFKNNELIATLNANESHIFELNSNEKSCFLESTNRAAVYLYHATRGGNSIGDPSVVWIAPIEQRIDEITFSTFNNENINIDTHHVNIIVNSSDVGSVYLDGDLLPSSDFESVIGNSNYSFTRKNIPHGVHHLQCNSGFNAHVYGFGVAKGYAYLVGSKTIDLSTQVHMNDVLVPKLDTYDYCPDKAITFKAIVNAANYNLIWDFGDGTTSTQNPITHTYDEKRVYEVTLTVTTAKGSMANEVSTYYVDTRINTFTEEAEICVGNTYTDHGFNLTITADTLLGTEINNELHPVCKDSLLIYVTALPAYYATYSEFLCWQGDPMTYTEHGFNLYIDHPGTYNDQITMSVSGSCDSIIDLNLVVTDRIVNPTPIEYNGCEDSFSWNGTTYTESGNYEQVLQSVIGCDSIIQLHIVLNKPIEGGTDTISESCSAIEWHGQLYNQAGFYTDTIQSIVGCDSIVHLDLNFALAADPSEIHSMDTLNQSPHWVITASEFEIRYYDFHLWDSNPDMEWDSVVWSLENNQSNWELRPFGESDRCCRVIVLNRVEDTVWLCANVYDPCHPGESIERRYWLVCTFYGIDDNNLSTSASIDIVPNPNNGQMSIVFNRVTAAINVSVYDMKGLLIDRFALPNQDKPYTFSYDMKYKKAGLYLFVFDYQGQTFTKKVIINE